MFWIGNYTFTAISICKKNKREFKHFDISKIDNNELCGVKIDEQVNMLIHERIKIIIYCRKGEGNVKVFDFNETIPHRCLNYDTKNPSLCFDMFERRSCY